MLARDHRRGNGPRRGREFDPPVGPREVRRDAVRPGGFGRPLGRRRRRPRRRRLAGVAGRLRRSVPRVAQTVDDDQAVPGSGDPGPAGALGRVRPDALPGREVERGQRGRLVVEAVGEHVDRAVGDDRRGASMARGLGVDAGVSSVRVAVEEAASVGDRVGAGVGVGWGRTRRTVIRWRGSALWGSRPRHRGPGRRHHSPVGRPTARARVPRPGAPSRSQRAVATANSPNWTARYGVGSGGRWAANDSSPA